MSESVGSIYFTVEAETAKLIDASERAQGALDELNTSFGKTDKQAKATEKTIGGAGDAFSRAGSDAKSATTGVTALGSTLEQTTKRAQDADQAASKAGASLVGVGTSARVAMPSAAALGTTLEQTTKRAQGSQFQMTQTAGAVQQLAHESQSAVSHLARLGKALGGLLAIQGVNGLIQMAEGYNEMAERVRMATASQAEYELVQQRLLATANGTYRAMSEAQEVYILTADSLRSMGYSTSQALDITDSLSYAFVKNATSVDRAQSTISAYTGAVMTGKVEADAWKTIIGAIPSVINDLSTSTGKSAAEIRKMGAEGKLTTQILNEGLRQSLDGNKTAADGMATTVRDAFTALRNNLAAYVGEANQATGATSVLSQSILLLGENLDTIVKLLMVAGAGAMAKYIAQIGLKTVATLKDLAATRAQTVAEISLAKAQVTVAQAALAETKSMADNAVSKAVAAARTDALAAANTRLAAASRAAGTATGLLTATLGGPVGIVALVASVAAGMFLFSDGSEKAKASLDGLDGSLESTKTKLNELAESQRAAMQTSAEKELLSAVKELGDAYSDLARGVATDGTKHMAAWRSANGKAIDELIEKAKAGEISYKEFVSSQ